MKNLSITSLQAVHGSGKDVLMKSRCDCDCDCFLKDAVGSDLVLSVNVLHHSDSCRLVLLFSRRPWIADSLILFIHVVYQVFRVTCVFCGINSSVHQALIHFFHLLHLVASVRLAGRPRRQWARWPSRELNLALF